MKDKITLEGLIENLIEKGLDEPDAIAIFLVKGHAGSATVLSKDDGIEGLINKISLVHTIKSTLTGGLALPSALEEYGKSKGIIKSVSMSELPDEDDKTADAEEFLKSVLKAAENLLDNGREGESDD